MSAYTPPLAKLIEQFQKLPGVGPKTAQRLAFHVLKQPGEYSHQFADALVQAKELIAPCKLCFNLSCESPCEICTNHRRNPATLCVISEPHDLFALERVHAFDGIYHVLGGLISPLDGIGPEKLNIKALITRLERSLTESESFPIVEVILALPPSTEGDTTSLFIQHQIQSHPSLQSIRLSRIAFGLPAGGELEYADSLTLTRALQGRQLMAV